METKILSSLGKIAGLGGIALGVFILIFRDLLQQRFFPEAGLDAAQAFAVIMSLMLLTFGVAAIGVFTWLITQTAPPKTPVPTPVLIILAVLIALVVIAAIFQGSQLAIGRSEEITPPVITDISPPAADQTEKVKTAQKLVEDNIRTAFSGGRDQPNPGCQNHDTESCVTPLRGGSFVAGSAHFVVSNMSDNSGVRTSYKLTVDTPTRVCYFLHAQTGACQTRYEMSGRATAMEQYEPN